MAIRNVEYTSLTKDERLVIAKDALRAKESDHYRLRILLSDADTTKETRLNEIADDIDRIQAEVSAVEAATAPESVSAPAKK